MYPDIHTSGGQQRGSGRERIALGKGEACVAQDKDCLKAPDEMSGLYLHRSNSLDDSGRQWKNNGAQVIITDELLNLHACNMFGAEAKK